MTGLDYLLQSVLSLSGVNIDEFKTQTTALVQKFIQQDATLTKIASDQEKILAQQAQILEALNVGDVEQHPVRPNVRIVSDEPDVTAIDHLNRITAGRV